MVGHDIAPDLDEAFRRSVPPFSAARNTTERPVAALGAKFRRARADVLDPTAAGTAQPAAAQVSGTRPEHSPAEHGNNKGVSTSRPLEEVKR